MKNNVCMILVMGFFLSSVAFSQQTSSDFKAKADALYTKKKYDKAVEYYQKAIQWELVQSVPNNYTLGACHEYIAYCYYELKNYNIVPGIFEKAIYYYRQDGYLDEVTELVPWIASFYNYAMVIDYAFDLPDWGETKPAVVAYRISKIDEYLGNTVMVTINSGLCDGIMNNAKGEALGAFRPEFTDRANLELGTAEVFELTKNEAKAKITLKNPEDSISKVYEGDMVQLPAYIPDREFKSVFYDLALLNIDFLNINAKQLYHIRHIINYDSPDLENDILRIMKNDVRETGEMIRPMIEDNPSWAVPLDSGRYKGLSMVDVLENCSMDDIYAFLLFVKSFPGKYMGHSWKINETFATWVINYSPMGYDEFKTQLLKKDNEELVKLAWEYKTDIIGGFNDDLNADALDFANQGKFEEAYLYNDFTIRLAVILGNDNLLGWGYFKKGEILDEENRYHESIEYYNKALHYFERSNDSIGIAYAYNNIGLQYSNLDMYDKSAEAYQHSATIKSEMIKTNTSSDLMVSLGRSMKGLGSCKYYLGKYNEAMAIYLEANRINEQSNSIDGIKAQADIYYWLGKANEKLGNYNEAVNYFKKQYQYNVETGNLGGQADALDNIAFNTENTEESNQIYQQAYQIKVSLGDKDGAGFSMSNVGQTYWTLGEYEKAISAHEMALQLRREANNKSGQAYSLSMLAGLYKDSGDPQKAITHYNEALAIYTELGEKKEVAEMYANIAGTYSNVKDYLKAIEYYDRCIAISDSISDLYEFAYNLFQLGNVYYDDKKYDKARDCYEQSLKVRREIGDKTGQSYNLINIGLIERIANYNMELAEKYYREAMQLAYETENTDNIAYCSRSIGYHFSSNGQYDSSLVFFEKALLLYRELNDRTNEATTLINIGYTYEYMGEFEEGENYFDEAYQLAEQGFDRINMSSALTAKGDLKRRYGEYNKSLEIENQSLSLSLEVDNKWGVAASYISLGNIYNSMGEYQKSIHYYMASDSMYKMISGLESSSTPMNNIGTIFYWQGNYDEALSYFKKAQALLESTIVDKDFLALIKGNIGEVYFYKKMYDSAHIYLSQSLKMCTETGNTSYQASARLILARLYLEEKMLDKVKENLEAISQLLFGSNEKTALAEMNLLFGRYYLETGNYDQAYIYFDKSIAITRQIGARKQLWEPLYLLSDVYKKQNMLDSAIVTLEESIEVIEYLKNRVAGGKDAQKLFSSVEMVSKVYELMVQMLLQKGNVEGALKYLEKGNNESLRGKFRNLDIAFADSTKNTYLTTEKEFKNKIETINEEIEKEKTKPNIEQSPELIQRLEQIKTIAQNDYRNFINDVIQAQPSLRNYFTMSENPMDFKAQKRNIPEDMAVLLYLLSENNLYIFVGTSDSVFAKVIDVVKSEVETEIINLYNLIKSPSFTGTLDVTVRGAKVVEQEDGNDASRKDYFISLSANLYQLLIEPVATEISSKKKLAIIPNGILYYLPFQVLIEQGEDDKYAYLAGKFSIFYTNRLSYLTNMFYPAENCPDLMAIGNADNTLPYSEVEVKTLEKIFDDAIVLVKEEATKKNVFGNTSCYSILHFATHGVLDYNDYDNSYLVLASDPVSGDDGKLRIDEVFGLRSIENCKLVTLSACETAVSMQMLEGWPITTASAFLQAGVPSVVASLWSVDDKATSILMEKFYSNLKTMDTLDALHQAQMDMASDEKYSHPYYWAPFLLVGSWK